MTRTIWLVLCGILIAAAMGLTFMSLSGPRSDAMPARQETQLRPRTIEISTSPIQQCVNLGGALEADNEGDWGYVIRERDLHMIRELGFDTVRIPVKWSAHAKSRAPYEIDQLFFRRVDTVAAQALAAGLQVIIDVHHYEEVNENPDRHLPRLYAFWEQIAERYASWPDGLYFEVLNEPHTNLTLRRIEQMNRDILSIIRETNPNRWVILGGGQWGNLEGLVPTNPPHDPRAMVTFHYYSPFEFTHQGAPWAYEPMPLGRTWGSQAEREEVISHFAAAAEYGQRIGMPVFLGEFGVYEEVPDADRANWTRHIRRTAEQYGIGWCYWDWATSLGMYSLENEQLRPGMGAALLGD